MKKTLSTGAEEHRLELGMATCPKQHKVTLGICDVAGGRDG